MAITRRCQTVSLLLLAILALGACNSELPKPSYTRTMLKVSRSLPGETEELKVRTSEGNLATLIVKRRDKSSSVSIAPDDSKLAPRLSPREEAKNVTAEDRSGLSDVPRVSELDDDDVRKRNEVRKLEEAQVEQIRATFAKSFEPREEKADVSRAEQRPILARNQPISDSAIDYSNWTPLDVDGRALKHEQSQDDDDERQEAEEEYRNWKPLQTESSESSVVNEDHGFREARPGILLARNFQDRAQRNLEFEDRDGKSERYYNYIPHQPRPLTRTNIGANLSKNRDGKAVPPEVIVRSEINVKAVPKRSAMSLDSDGTPVIHGTRVPDEPIDKIQTWRNARIINNKLISDAGPTTTAEPSADPHLADSAEKRLRFDKFFKDINRRYGRNYDEEGRNVYFEWDPRNYKNEALKAEVYETRNGEPYRASVHKRMLHPDGIASYPISQRYTPSSQTIAPVALKPGARAPVLQYAHPELGVQPAKILKNEKRRPENFPENQHSFTEQRHKKKYVLNDKSIVDSYTMKNYYPNQHFYGLKRPNEPPFWVKISENLKNQFSTGVEKVSQFTRPVIDPLVEATHKISQNLGLSKGKEAQDKVGTVATGTSILIPALGLVASGAALGIGAVAVGRYLDVDVLKRSNGQDADLEHKRALEVAARFATSDSERATPQTLYVLQDVPQDSGKVEHKSVNSMEGDGVFLILEEDKRNAERVENRESRQMVDERDYVETSRRRRRRSLDYLDVLKTETDVRNLVRSKRFQRKGADSISEIVEIDLPADGRVDITELLIPRRSSKRDPNKNTVLIVEDGTTKIPAENLKIDAPRRAALANNARIAEDIIDTQDAASIASSKQYSGQREKNRLIDNMLSALHGSTRVFGSNPGREITSVERIVQGLDDMIDADSPRSDTTRRKRNVDSNQELEDALQNLENAEVAEFAHVQGDWTNTPCAKRIFCDAMMQRGPDASMLMEKKMAALLALIQPAAAVQVSSHFEEVMNAVRRHDCSSFLCPQARPGNIFF